MKKIYIVILNGSYDWEPDYRVLGAFTDREKAVACLRSKADELRHDWDEDEIEEDRDTYFLAQQRGCYNENHAELCLHEMELQ